MRWLAILFAVVAALSACNEPGPRPARAGRCDGGCPAPPPVPGEGNPGTDAGETGTPAPLEVSEVRELIDTTRATAQPFNQIVDISAPAPEGRAAQGQLTPGTGLSLTVLRGTAVWVTVTPPDLNRDLVTLQNVDTTQSDLVTLFVASQAMVDQVLVGGVFSQPLTQDPHAAQVLVSFVGPDQRGVPNVSVTVSSSTPVLLSAAGVWVDTVGVTDQSGQAFLVNVPAGAGTASLTYTPATGANAGLGVEVGFRVAEGAVTLLDLLVE